MTSHCQMTSLMPVWIATAIVSATPGTVGHVLTTMNRNLQVESIGSAQNVCANVKIMTFAALISNLSEAANVLDMHTQ